jgi:hypothetical protein
LQLIPDGTAVLELHRRWADGTTHLAFDTVELLERLARILRHLGLPDVVPEMRPSRAPPLRFDSYHEGVPGDDD